MLRALFLIILSFQVYTLAAIDSASKASSSSPAAKAIQTPVHIQKLLEEEMQQELGDLDDAGTLEEDLKAINVSTEIVNELKKLQAQAEEDSEQLITVDPMGQQPDENPDENIEQTELPSIDPDQEHLRLLNDGDEPEVESDLGIE